MKKPSNRTRGAAQRKPKPASDAPQREHLDELLDRALADSFPASDPRGSLVPETPPAGPSAAPKKRRGR